MKWPIKWQSGGKGSWVLLLVLAATLGLCALFSSGTGSKSSEEQQLCRVLSAIQGAGRVEAAVFYDQAEQDSLLGMQGGSHPTGCVVVAEGAGDLLVRFRLIHAARTLLGLTEDQVEVFEMAQEEEK